MSAQNEHEEGLQWLRACSLIVADSSDQGLDLSELRIVFDVRKGETETPNSAEIRVYNLSEATMSRMRREFTRVILQAGYRSNYGIIFDGNIRQTLQGRENGTDTYIEIIAADGDLTPVAILNGDVSPDLTITCALWILGTVRIARLIRSASCASYNCLACASVTANPAAPAIIDRSAPPGPITP